MKNILKHLSYATLLICSMLIFSCEPYEADDIELPAGPTANFTFSYMPGDSNFVIFQSTGDEGFQRLWDFNNGATSSLLQDTAYFPSAGTYNVTLTVSARGGTATNTQVVTISSSDASSCNDDNLIFLTGGCTDTDGKTWNLSTAAGAVIVGPSPGSDQWYSSPVNGLDPDQADDVYHFFADDNEYDYINNGMTIYPECGYTPKPFTADPDATWQLAEGAGWDGTDQIILTPNSFIGTKDSGPKYDIISISEDEMVLQSEVIGAAGFFRFTLVKIQ